MREAEEDALSDEEFATLKKILAAKYLCNFSLFRSAPDSWAIKQLFPIVPLHRLDEPSVDFATLVDVTCDSDGKIDHFVDLRDDKETLELPHFKDDQPYYLAIFLIGAYQEVMGSFHNLFGLPNEAQVVMDADGRYHITKLVNGSRITDMLAFAKYDQNQLVEAFRKKLTAEAEAGRLTAEAAATIAGQYDRAAGRTTYLE